MTMRKALPVMVLFCGAASVDAAMMKPVFILVFSITSGGATIEGEVEQTFATKQECMADREKLIEAHHKAYPPQSPGEGITAYCKQVKR